jgi:hypothetical protein
MSTASSTNELDTFKEFVSLHAGKQCSGKNLKDDPISGRLVGCYVNGLIIESNPKAHRIFEKDLAPPYPASYVRTGYSTRYFYVADPRASLNTVSMSSIVFADTNVVAPVAPVAIPEPEPVQKFKPSRCDHSKLCIDGFCHIAYTGLKEETYAIQNRM